MLSSSFCNYSESYILARGTITVATTAASAAANNVIEKVMFKILCHLLTV